MTRPVLAIDIDDVLFPFLPNMTEHHNDQFGTNLSIEDYVSYDFRQIWGGEQDEITDKIEKFLAMDLRHIPPLEQATDVIAGLGEKYRLVIVTSRDRLIKNSTLSWLTHHFPDVFADVVFAGNHATGRPAVTKVEVCKELGAITLIDDNLKYVLEAADGGIDCILFGNYPWNQVDRLPDNVQRLNDWLEVGRVLIDG